MRTRGAISRGILWAGNAWNKSISWLLFLGVSAVSAIAASSCNMHPVFANFSDTTIMTQLGLLLTVGQHPYTTHCRKCNAGANGILTQTSWRERPIRERKHFFGRIKAYGANKDEVVQHRNEDRHKSYASPDSAENKSQWGKEFLEVEWTWVHQKLADVLLTANRCFGN